jgi:hypothetical protein
MNHHQSPDISALFALLTGPAELQPSERDPLVDDLEVDDDSDSGTTEDEAAADEAADEDDAAAKEAAADEAAAKEEEAADVVIPPLFPAERKLVLTDDPLEALAENDRYRNASPGCAQVGVVTDFGDINLGLGLWSVDEWAAALPRQYKYVVQTLAPRHWPMATPLRQEEFNRRFATEFPEVATFLKTVKNVFVAGGAAAWPLGESSVKVGDVDFFIAGIDPTDRAALWGKVDEIVRKLRRAFTRASDDDNRRAVIISETLSPGLVTITVRNVSAQHSHQKVLRKFQIILRAFPSVSSILHGFDVPACCIAYDGRRTHLTYLAAWAHAFRVNIVCPAYRSLTYERRLVKYFERGFALALPHLRRGVLAKDVPLQLPHLVLRPTIVRGFFAVGNIALPAGEPVPESDYDIARDRVWSLCESAAWAPGHINLSQLASGENRFIVLRVVRREFRRFSQYRRRLPPDENNKGLPFAEFATSELKFADILPRTLFEKLLNIATKAAVNRGGLVNSVALRRIFRLTDAEISRFTLAVDAALRRNPGRRLDMSPALARFRTALVAAYDATPADIGWWIVTDPSRQYTVSLNPRMETPDLWYGEACATDAAPPSADDFIEALLGTLEARQGNSDGRPVFDGMCPLCCEPLARGVANSVILPCGHIFHWSETADGCSGLHSWAVNHHNCPSCRQDFVGRLSTARPEAQDAVEVDIAW